MTGLYHVSIFINGCLGDYDAWFDHEQDAIDDVEQWQYGYPVPLVWNLGQCMHGPGTDILKGYYTDSAYMAEIIHYPTFAYCDCAGNRDELDHERGIYDTETGDHCDDCESKMQASIDAWERVQP